MFIIAVGFVKQASIWRPTSGGNTPFLAAVLLVFALVEVGLGGCAGTTTSTSAPAPTTTTPSSSAPTALSLPVPPAHWDVTTGSTGQVGGILLADVDPALLTGNFARCPECHSLLDRAASQNPALVQQFEHGFHLEKGARCADCHEVPTHTEIAIRKPTMIKCFGCHSQTDTAAPSGACATCHPRNFPLKPTTHEASDWLPSREQLVTTRATHPKAAQESPKGCELCHTKTFCSDCHGLDMPHPQDWQNVHSEKAVDVGGKVCMRCHPNNESCQVCHHPGYKPGGPPWWQIHPQAVYNEGPDLCLQCHSTLTCARCHTTGEYKDFTE